MPQATVVVCSTCKRDGELVGPRLVAATRAASVAGVEVRSVRCLGNCSRGPSAVIRIDGGFTYLFGSLDPAADGHSLIAGARLMSAAADGLMPWRDRPEPLRRGMIARIPPVDFPEG